MHNLFWCSSFQRLGQLLTNKNLKSSVFVFPVIYLLTVVALILAGNKQVKGLNLEAVIFSLAIGLLISNSFQTAGLVPGGAFYGVVRKDWIGAIGNQCNLLGYFEGRFTGIDSGIGRGNQCVVLCLLALQEIKG